MSSLYKIIFDFQNYFEISQQCKQAVHGSGYYNLCTCQVASLNELKFFTLNKWNIGILWCRQVMLYGINEFVKPMKWGVTTRVKLCVYTSYNTFFFFEAVCSQGWGLGIGQWKRGLVCWPFDFKWQIPV